MNPEDLRIGNLIAAFTEIHIVDEILKCSVETHELGKIEPKSSYPYHLLNPILLTEDWLLKFGWTKDGTKWDRETEKEFVLYQGIFLIIEKGGCFYVWHDCDEDNWYSYIGKELKYVHKLQNYCFEVYDKDLIIEL
jgi:hypothetical protein